MLTDSFVTAIAWGGLGRVRQGEREKRKEDDENTKQYFNKEKVVRLMYRLPGLYLPQAHVKKSTLNYRARAICALSL